MKTLESSSHKRKRKRNHPRGGFLMEKTMKIDINLDQREDDEAVIYDDEIYYEATDEYEDRRREWESDMADDAAWIRRNL